jgi:transcriptional regulator with XRE-family HTH domain
MTIEEAFGAVLRELRISCGVTQETLAFNAQLDRTFISLLERGQRQPSLATVFRLSNALRLPPAEIVDRVERKLNATSSPDLRTTSI